MPEIQSFEEAVQKRNILIEAAKTAPKSGYRSLDNMIQGFLPGQLTVVTGVSSMGKTTFVANVAANVCLQEKYVLFFSLESGVNVVDPISTVLGMRDSQHLKLCSPDQSMSFREVISTIERNLHQTDLVILDHIHYLTKADGIQMSVKISDIVRQLQLNARRLQVPIIVVAHTRKLLNDKSLPGINDIKDASALYQDPSTVLFIHRFRKTPDEVAPGEDLISKNGILIVSKNRDFGKTGNLSLEFDPTTLRIAIEGQWPGEKESKLEKDVRDILDAQ